MGAGHTLLLLLPNAPIDGAARNVLMDTYESYSCGSGRIVCYTLYSSLAAP
jgi:hypothetical protein